MAFDLDRIREIAARVAASAGLELVELEFRGGGKARMLRVFLDRAAAEAGSPAGVTHEDCANFSREFGTILDVEDVIPGGSYVLEVSSPGLDRRLMRPADFERFAGSRIKLSTRDLINGNRHFEGKLESFHDGVLTIDLSQRKSGKKKARGDESGGPQKIEIALSNVEKANLVPEI
jgi:ribosome maturation factor RimP